MSGAPRGPGGRRAARRAGALGLGLALWVGGTAAARADCVPAYAALGESGSGVLVGRLSIERVAAAYVGFKALDGCWIEGSFTLARHSASSSGAHVVSEVEGYASDAAFCALGAGHAAKTEIVDGCCDGNDGGDVSCALRTGGVLRGWFGGQRGNGVRLRPAR